MVKLERVRRAFRGIDDDTGEYIYFFRRRGRWVAQRYTRELFFSKWVRKLTIKVMLSIDYTERKDKSRNIHVEAVAITNFSFPRDELPDLERIARDMQARLAEIVEEEFGDIVRMAKLGESLHSEEHCLDGDCPEEGEMCWAKVWWHSDPDRAKEERDCEAL